jgi:hypothetical protein
VSKNLVLLAAPKEFKLADPALLADVDETTDGFWVTVSSKNPALWVWLDLEGMDAKYGDNFFHLLPDGPQKIFVQPSSRANKTDFAKQLRVRSLFDTYAPA